MIQSQGATACWNIDGSAPGRKAGTGVKLMEPLRPEPPSPRIEPWPIVALALMVLGAALALYCLFDAGTIGAQELLGTMILLAAASTGVIIAVSRGRQAYSGPRRRFKEVPPPLEIYTVWPPESGRGPKHDVQRKSSRRPAGIGGGSASRSTARKKKS